MNIITFAVVLLFVQTSTALYFIIIFKAQQFSLISHDLCKPHVHKRFKLIKQYISTTHVIL